MPDDNPPNIVLITCHDLGQHLGCYGADVRSPAIDSLAADGVRFENYFCAAPQCSPSRGAISTGRFPHRNGLMGLVHRGWDLNEDETTLPAYLAGEGYSTHLFGLQHEAVTPDRLGYQQAHTESTSALDVAEFFREQGGTLADEQPFFAGVGFTETHSPWGNDRYDRPDPESIDLPGFLPDEPDVRADLADMHQDVRAVDDAVQHIREVLAQQGLAEETVVIFTADHGIAFPGAKMTCYDAGLSTPLIMHHPGSIEGGRVYEDTIHSNVDLLPTILDLVGAETPATMDGRSFLALLEDREYVGRDRVFAEQTWHVRPDITRAVRTDRFKYVQNFATHRRREGIRGRGKDDEWPEEELYDLANDPHEQNNLASTHSFDSGRVGASGAPDWLAPDWLEEASGPDPDYEDVRTALRAELYDWMDRTGDPLFEGHIPLSDHDRGRFSGEPSPPW